MNANQILSADLLDLVFNDRNKAYGAYELRKSYDSRIKKALGITSLVLLLGVGGHLMARSVKNSKPVVMMEKHVIELSDIPDEPPPPQLPPPPVEQPPVQTIQWTTPVLVEETQTPPPDLTEVEQARIDVVTTEGAPDDGIVKPAEIDNGSRVIEEQVAKEPEIYTTVQVDASFKGDWSRFLLRYLNGNVPVENGAPAGKYTVVIQFVVDLDGKVSDIKPLTSIGYGMEEEAIRVLKKADNWTPAIQNGHQVKAYRRQPITFKIDE